MAYFRYFAVNQQGRRQRGIIVAVHEADLSQRLAAMGLDLVTACAVSPRVNNRLNRRELITLFVQLTHASRAGIALLDGLRDVRDSTTHPEMRGVVATLLADMETGVTLSSAMAAQPAIFDALMINLVRVGETAGALDAIFMHISDNLKRQDELRAQTRRILLYPLLVLFMVSVVVVMLLWFLVPQIVQLMHSMNMAIPIGTRVMQSVSQGLQVGWWWMLGLTGLIGFGGLALHRRYIPFRVWCDGWKLRLPAIGGVLQKIELARFADMFAVMYQAGIPIFEALVLAADMVENRVLAEAVCRVRESVINGECLSIACAREQLFPPLVVSMLRVAEKTGALDHALLEVSYFYQRDVNEAIAQALKLLEPVLTLVLGLVLASIVSMVLLPLYDVLGTVRL